MEQEFEFLDHFGRVSELNRANLRKLDRGEVAAAMELSEDEDELNQNIDEDDDLADFDVEDEDGSSNYLEDKLSSQRISIIPQRIS